jgi:hypothetical protein
LRRIALRHFHPITMRRRFYRYLVRVSMLTHLDWLISDDFDVASLFGGANDFGSWIEKLEVLLGTKRLFPAVFWPRHEGRGRVYVHLFSEDFESVAFAKVALRPHDSVQLARESSVLRALAREPMRSCRVPRLLDEGTVGGRAYLLMQALPDAARPIGRAREALPAGLVAEMAGRARRVPGSAVGELSWWPSYDAMVGPEIGAFHADLLASIAGRDVGVCRAHGDLSPANIFADEAGMWLVDWEASCADAPAQVDRIGFETACLPALSRGEPDAMCRAFKARYLDGPGGAARRADVLLALAFRHARGHSSAAAITKHW